MAQQDDLYSALGLSKTATAEQIRAAYRKMARRYHPDLNPGNKQAEEQFKKISAAHDVLSDPKRRKLYDEFGKAALQGDFDSEHARAFRQRGARSRRAAPEYFEAGENEYDLGDLFGGLFGGAGKGRRSKTTAGQDVITTVELDLAQALAGVEIHVQIPGSPQRAPITVRVPPGAEDGSRLRVSGRGIPAPGGGSSGDLIIETRVRPHPHFRREGLDLILKLPVTIHEAYCGASVEVPTPDGQVRLKIPRLSQSGTRLRLRGKGVLKGGQRGDLYAELDVRLPDREDARLAQAFDDARHSYSHPVRDEVKL